MFRRTYRALALTTMLVAACGGDSDDGAGGTGGVGGDGGKGGAPTVEPGPTCIAFCIQVIGQCPVYSFNEETCQQGCQTNLDDEYAHDEACGEAVETVFLCVSELDDCEDVEAWRTQTPSDTFACRSEVLVVDGLIANGTCVP